MYCDERHRKTMYEMARKEKAKQVGRQDFKEQHETS